MSNIFLNALKSCNSDRPPVWLMRQAGRYMPEYRKLRSKYSFLEMCHTPELIAQVTQLPIQTFGFDAAILFSDILMLPEAMQVGLRFEENQGPIIDRPVRDRHAIEQLPRIDNKESLGFIAKGIELLKRSLSVPLIGFSGAPFTVASYMVEGRSSANYKQTKQWMLRDPVGFHQLLQHLTEATIGYLKMQIEAGVDALQIFDSWASVLAPRQFREFALYYIKTIIDSLKDTGVPIIVFCRGSSIFAHEIASCNPAAISIDWNGDLNHLRKSIPSSIALQGNLDPDVLYASPDIVKDEVTSILQSMQNDPGFVFNLGHGIHPDTPMESVYALVEAVHSSKSAE